MSAKEVDVLICGAGPVGLVLTYQLARFGLSAYNIEQHEKLTQAAFGRAASLYPRTIEMLEQLDLAEGLQQIGFIGRSSVTLKDGHRVPGRGFTFISSVTDTFVDYALNIRQKYSEQCFREALKEKYNLEVHEQQTLKSFVLDENAKDDLKVVAQIQTAAGETLTVRAKYLIGADGGKSTVRHLAQIPFEGASTTDHWVRIDGVVETDIPDTRAGLARAGFGSIESPEHGNILLASLDHGVTRVGFALTPAMYEKYGPEMTREQIIFEAKRAVAPFSIEFKTVDWHTVYGIGQRVAARFQDRERILLAGDASHTHSSGAAQGMNTGVHDAVNLGWKLAGVINGLYQPVVLETYSPERRGVAQHLINLDKSISALQSGRIPEGLAKSSASTDPNVVLAELMEAQAPFTTGLNVYYEANNILNKESHVVDVQVGHRAPDVLISKPGNRIPIRLFDVTKNNGKYWVIVFAGQPLITRPVLQRLREHLDTTDPIVRRRIDASNHLTLIGTSSNNADELMGVHRFGNAYYDVDQSAHLRYGVPLDRGAILCIRPDGILGYAAMLDDIASVSSYFESIIRRV